MIDYNFLVEPETLIFRAESMNNWLHIKSKINNKDLNQIATEVAMSWTDDYADSEQGFGSGNIESRSNCATIWVKKCKLG